MAKVEARAKIKGKNFEIHVDLDEALKVKAGSGDITAALDSPNIYYDLKKATVASQSDLKEYFGTTDVYQIAKTIIIKGEVQKTQEFRDEEKEKKINQVVSLLVKNATDQHGRPWTEERLRTAIKEIHYNFDNRPADQQLMDVLDKLKSIIPIKIESKRIKLKVPARYTGQVYGIIKEGKESEEWLPNGDLQVVINIPAGMLLDFYDKLNSITHGSAQAEEIKQ